MKRLMILVLFAFCATMLQATENKSLLGSWDFKVAEAPAEYSTGKLIFTEKEGEVTGVVKFMDGTEIKVRNLKIENNVFSLVADIETIEVTLKAKIADGKITGKVDSSQGLMNMIAERTKN